MCFFMEKSLKLEGKAEGRRQKKEMSLAFQTIQKNHVARISLPNKSEILNR